MNKQKNDTANTRRTIGVKIALLVGLGFLAILALGQMFQTSYNESFSMTQTAIQSTYTPLP